FIEEAPAQMPRSPNRAHSQPFGGDRIDLAITVTRDQHLRPVLCAFDEGDEKMLSMPHGDDDRAIARRSLVNVLRLCDDRARIPHQAQILGRHDRAQRLERSRPKETPGPRHRRRAQRLVSDSEVRIVLRHPRLRASEWNLVWLWLRSPHCGFAAKMMRSSEPE